MERRPLDQVDAQAERVLAALCAKFGDRVPDDVMTVVSYWRSSRAGFERATAQLIHYAHVHGVDAEHPRSTK